MRKIIAILACVLLTVEMSAQQVIKSSEVSEYRSISLSGKLVVQLIPSDSNAIEINLFDSDITKLKWGVNNDDLNVTLRPTSSGGGRAEVKIYYKQIDALTVSGAEVNSKEPIESNMFTLKASSSATVTVEFQCKDMDIEAGSNSVLLLNGYSKYLNLRSTEKSKLEARALICVSAVATATSGGEIYVCAEERLEAFAKTGSTIFYKGEPTILRVPTSKIMGMGASVHNIGK